jgi:L-threonylcarbamoyladenylate synthase
VSPDGGDCLDSIEEAAKTLRDGGVVAYPTDTLWGLGASIEHEAAVRKIFEIKKRPLSEPLSIAVSSTDQISEYAYLTSAARRLFPLLPGPLTIVLERRETVPDFVNASGKTVGIRVPGHPECLQLLEAAGPITSTSANLHHQPEPRTMEEIRQVFGDRVDFYLEAGSTPLGRPSTLVDATVDPVRILRPGAIRDARIRELFLD